MTQKQIPVRFTGEEELELYEFLRKESFDTGLAMAEIIRQGIKLYKNQKEEGETMYSVYYQDEKLREVPLGENLTKRQAAELAEKNASKGKVFVRFHRKSDGQVGYLNQDGNHDITGRVWVEE